MRKSKRNQPNRPNLKQWTTSSSDCSDDVRSPTQSEIYLQRKYELPPDPVFEREVITDPIVLGQIHDECENLFKLHKITPQNAFSFRLIECLDEVIKLQSDDKNDMHEVGKTLEMGTKIFVCRVQHTHDMVSTLAENSEENKKRLEEFVDPDRARDDVKPGDGSLLFDDNGNQTSYELTQIEKAFDCMDDNKNIGKEHEFDMDEFNIENNGELRRLKLKESFDSYAFGAKKFDYASLIFGNSHLKEKVGSQVGTKMNEIPFDPMIINISALGHLKKLEFLRFGKNKFDLENYDIWGNPKNVTGVNNDDNMRGRLLEKRRQLRERLAIRRDDLLSQHIYRKSQECTQKIGNDVPASSVSMDSQSVHSMSQDPGDLEDVKVPEHMHDDYNPVDMDGELKQLNIHEITSLDDVDHYYNVLKNFKLIEPNVYGWAGPAFIPRRLRCSRRKHPNDPLKPKREPKRRKCPAKPVDVFAVTLDEPTNCYWQVLNHKTKFTDKQTKKYQEYTLVIPSMGESEDKDVPEEANDLLFYTAFQRLTKFTIDSKRNIFESITKSKNTKPEPDIESSHDDCQDPGDEYFDDGPFFQPINPIAEPDEDIQGIRELDEEVIALGTHDSFISEIDLELLRRHKFIPAPVDFGYEAEEHPLTCYSENESLTYAKRPKPINIFKMKEYIRKHLKEKLVLDECGHPVREEPTQLDMVTLISEMVSTLDDVTIRHWTTSLTLVATLDVVAELKLFMDSGKLGSNGNPLIICHGKNWKHGDNMSGLTVERPVHIRISADESEADVEKPKRIRKDTNKKYTDQAQEIENSEEAFMDTSDLEVATMFPD